MFVFRFATPDHAEQIARIVIDTGEGVVGHLFDGLVPGVNSETLLSAIFMKGEGAYRADNVLLSEENEEITSLLFAYPATEHKVLSLMEGLLPPRRLDPVRPFLERAVPDSLFVNTLWVAGHLRGKGFGDALLLEAADRCRRLGFDRISLFCWNDNEYAMQFYLRHGFETVEYIPREQLPLAGHDMGGSLLCKKLAPCPEGQGL